MGMILKLHGVSLEMNTAFKGLAVWIEVLRICVSGADMEGTLLC